MSEEITNVEETLFEFPCEFAIKAMGKHGDGALAITVIEIVSRHAPDTHNHTVKSKPSKDGNYLSITVTIEATSKKQLDAIYQDLTDHPHVLYAL
jgi:putative lipoic acid-binding regulatory protein